MAKTLKDIRNQMKRLVEDFYPGEGEDWSYYKFKWDSIPENKWIYGWRVGIYDEHNSTTIYLANPNKKTFIDDSEKAYVFKTKEEANKACADIENSFGWNKADEYTEEEFAFVERNYPFKF